MTVLHSNKILIDPQYFPLKLLDGQRIGYTKIAEDTFLKSPFLDSRIYGTDGKIFSISYSDVIAVLATKAVNTPKELIHLFHISHVGSTFISKLLECIENIKVLREPKILRDFVTEYSEIKKFASEYTKAELDQLLHIMLKTFSVGDDSKILIKQTSSNLSLPIGFNRIENINQKEIYLYTNLKNFLSHAISSDGLQTDSKMFIKNRLNLLNNLCLSNHLNLSDLGLLEKVSVIWMLELSKILSRSSSKQSLSINFDESFCANKREQSIKKIIEFIFDGELIDFDKIMNADAWQINSKNLQRFNFSKRAEMITQNYQSSKSEIDKVIMWVENLCKQEPYLMSLLQYIK